jgi:hypothetical protein
MKLISAPAHLQKEFLRLIRNYPQYYWATAWAGISPTLFKELEKNEDKISQLVIGTHFFQTHLDFIARFINSKKVRFIKQPEGTFHPKIYLFYDSDRKWEILIGSANFTYEAFTNNTEATVLISSTNNKSIELLNSALKLIKKCWSEGQYFTASDLDKYRTAWKNHRPKIKSLSGTYGGTTKKPKPIYEIPVTNMTWSDFVSKVASEKGHGLDNRLKVIKIAHSLFNKVNHFSELDEDERKFIAGIPNKLKVDKGVNWGYFGSMKGCGNFKNKIILNDKNISLALDQIPASGQITRAHYDDFLTYFKISFHGNYLATATRLLAMKRPDVFICLDSRNKSNLCKDFAIVQGGMNYDRYWDDIILRIYDSTWWQSPKPLNEKEDALSNARAAFLDSLYYDYKH